jgi:hypothetical protein
MQTERKALWEANKTRRSSSVFDGLWYGSSKMKMLEELIEPDYVFHFHSIINPTPEIGHEGYRKMLEGFAAAFPHNRATVEPIINSEGNFIVNR